MLMSIIAPAWETVKENDFLESLESWEVLTRRYEIQAKEHVSDSTKIAVLMKHAPMSLRSALRTAGAQVGTNYERAKKFVRDFLQAGQYYNAKGELGKDDGGAAPMDVGAVSIDKGKKGGKSKSEKGVNKGGKFDKKGKPPPPRRPRVKEKENVAAPMPSQRHRPRQLDLRPLLVDRAQMQCTTGCLVMESVWTGQMLKMCSTSRTSTQMRCG